jgi:hypothetical protein
MSGEPRWLTRLKLDAIHAELLSEHGGAPRLPQLIPFHRNTQHFTATKNSLPQLSLFCRSSVFFTAT